MDFSAQAMKIVKTLNSNGYIAYFAGGWVRDFVMKHPSMDIDIATDAPSDKIIDLFPHTILVGIAFGVVIVVIEGHQFEVATFRKDIEYLHGRRPERIEHSSDYEDAQRRDFTINGMFYDPIKEMVIDYVGGQKDIQKGLVRTIGDPHERFMEDRLRMIRAVRFACRFGFEIDFETQLAITAHAHTLFPAVAIERVWQEFNKMAIGPRFDQALIEMHRLGLLQQIFPSLNNVSLEEIEWRVSSFPYFPKDCPVILYLIELFPDHSLDELVKLAQDLKTSSYESKLIEFAYSSKQLMIKEESVEPFEWTRLYAHHAFPVFMHVIAAKYPSEQREEFIKRHLERRQKLMPHIERIMNKKPLVNASILIEHGISPGKVMGDLLKEAEYTAILYDLHDVDTVLSFLKTHPLWPQKE